MYHFLSTLPVFTPCPPCVLVYGSQVGTPSLSTLMRTALGGSPTATLLVLTTAPSLMMVTSTTEKEMTMTRHVSLLRIPTIAPSLLQNHCVMLQSTTHILFSHMIRPSFHR